LEEEVNGTDLMQKTPTKIDFQLSFLHEIKPFREGLRLSSRIVYSQPSGDYPDAIATRTNTSLRPIGPKKISED